MSDERKPCYRVILNMSAEGEVWLTIDHGEGVSHDIEVAPSTIEQAEDDLGYLHAKHSNAINNENLLALFNALHGIFWKAKDRWYKEKDTDGTDEE